MEEAVSECHSDLRMVHKKIGRIVNPGYRFLHQHPHGIFQELCQLLHELRRFGAVADAVVNGEGDLYEAFAFENYFTPLIPTF
jgi:hypothetical protein